MSMKKGERQRVNGKLVRRSEGRKWTAEQRTKFIHTMRLKRKGKRTSETMANSRRITGEAQNHSGFWVKLELAAEQLSITPKELLTAIGEVKYGGGR